MKDNAARTKNTKAALCKAFAKLVREKPMHSITVRELCDDAGVHRATFYYHYQDISEFYQEMEHDLFERLKRNYSEGTPHSVEVLFKSITVFIKENADLCSIFYGQPTGADVRDKIYDFLRLRYLGYMQFRFGKGHPDVDWELLSACFISACITLLTRWYRSSFELPSEHMTKLMLEINEHFDPLITKHYIAD